LAWRRIHGFQAGWRTTTSTSPKKWIQPKAKSAPGSAVERICQRGQGARLGEVVAVEDEDVGSGGGSRAGAQRSGYSAVGLADEPNRAAGGEVVEDGDRVRVA